MQVDEHGSGQVFEDALGQFTYDLHSPRVTAATNYDVASLTKVIGTTAIAMLLYQRGLLDLEMLVGDLLPAFVVGRDNSVWARKVTIRHLLAHSSGLPGYAPLFHQASSAADLLRACLSLPIQAKPGTHAEYSDPGFILLGKALEVLLQEEMAIFLHREVFVPLNMKKTGFGLQQVDRSHIPPTENDETFRKRTIQGEVQDEHAYLMGGIAGHAGIFSNVADLLRFASSMLNSGPHSLFSADTVEVFAQRQLPSGSSRALGWDTPSESSSSGSFFAPNSVGHLGYSGCSLWIDRQARLAVVLLTNRTWPDRSSQQIRAVRPAFHDALRKAMTSNSK